MSTRPSTDGPFGSAALYQSDWNTIFAGMPVAPAGYCDASLSIWDNVSNQATCGGFANDIAFHENVQFSVTLGQTGIWDLRIGPDFGRGGAVFLDGVAIDFNSNDMWWAGSYANPTQVFLESVNLTAGNHTLDVYGFEGCCDGGTQAQFQPPGGVFTTFGTSDGQDPVVPEPASVLLVASGLFGFGARLRRRLRA